MKCRNCASHFDVDEEGAEEVQFFLPSDPVLPPPVEQPSTTGPLCQTCLDDLSQRNLLA